MLHEINSVDPKLRIQVGSFRIDPQGNQKLNDIPLARSEVHLYEKLEGICTNLQNYALSTTAEGGSVYLRKVSSSGQVATGVNLQSFGDMGRFEHTCHNLVEDHEEDIIPALQSLTNEDYHEIICIDLASVCTAKNITEFEDLKRKLTYTSEAEGNKAASDADNLKNIHLNDEDDDENDDQDDDDGKSSDDDHRNEL
ncbi:hypothetical protein HELRODRAFT_165760 [Helobdella robusta]|uniref:DUF3456 domain-containing protein n=1 Tax=Helobdella robusta TaxID=6412 RepID=T1EX95_HELRO|nr:hypothetical protein HELRODRAFT_165760 [Helobdella robusta]ESN91699.1 hypothetical protein HELRODRAFT_165760 [Helobdella robusta]